MSTHHAAVSSRLRHLKEREVVSTPYTSTKRDRRVVHDQHSERREMLDQARSFRLEQLADLERELAEAPQESVKRALHRAATSVLAEIDAALDRISTGAYGWCITCARPIPEGRLDVLPMAAQCMPCHREEQNVARRLLSSSPISKLSAVPGKFL
jgi:DnaK suppressor protein